MLASPELRPLILETAVYLQARRRWPEWHYLADEAQVDLCEAEERVFVNSCWQLTEPTTLERAAAAMASGRRRFPDAEGVLLWHDAVLDIAQRIPEARPAWQWFLEQPVRRTGLQ